MEWAEKYRPEHLADIVGNTAAIRQMADWARTWTFRSKPLILYGKPGIGKTSAAYALARDMNWDVIELNASDQRTAAVIERIAGAGSTTASLTGSARKLVVMDEADNLQGTADRGGAKAIIECIKNARQPMLLIANDLYGLAPELRMRCEPVQFRALPARSIAPRLKFICAKEKVTCSEAAIHEIAESAGGDVRAAVNMLYASAIGRESLDGNQVHTSQKDERVSIFSLVSAVFSKTPDEELMKLSWDVDDIPENIEQWVEGNVHVITDPGAVERAYRSLARADEYIGYTYRRQYHTLWRYATAVMLLGVADAAGGKGIHTRILPPERWQKMSTAKKQKAIRYTVLSRLAAAMQIPQITLREKYLGTIALLVEHDPETFTRELMLDAEGLNFFLNDRARALEIVKAVTKTEHEKELEQKKKGRKTKAGTAGEEHDPAASPETKSPATPPGMPPEVQTIAPAPDASDKKPVANNQSTLFDGF
ncbi:MAG: replication factor C large subunit [Methanoregula sp.]|jgi:replication factor C large subunit|uniref:replication factor C large subunit n=1 Tax=Methanoregula sp. TaxID=2052170 RepID=UPI003D11B26A